MKYRALNTVIESIGGRDGEEVGHGSPLFTG